MENPVQPSYSNPACRCFATDRGESDRPFICHVFRSSIDNVWFQSASTCVSSLIHRLVTMVISFIVTHHLADPYLQRMCYSLQRGELPDRVDLRVSGRNGRGATWPSKTGTTALRKYIWCPHQGVNDECSAPSGGYIIVVNALLPSKKVNQTFLRY